MAGDGDVLQVAAADQRHGRERLDALLPSRHEREFGGGEPQGGSGVDGQHQVAHQFDGTGDVVPGGNVDRASAGGLGSLNGCAERLGGAGRTVVASAVVEHVEQGAGAPGAAGNQSQQRGQKSEYHGSLLDCCMTFSVTQSVQIASSPVHINGVPSSTALTKFSMAG